MMKEPTPPTPITYAFTTGPLSGETRTSTTTKKHPEHGVLVDFGSAKVGRKYQNICAKISDKPELAAEVSRYEAESTEYKTAMAEYLAEVKRALVDGSLPITLNWRHGSPLSGYVVGGDYHVSNAAEDLLASVGMTEDISGWGTMVSDAMAKALGESFTWPQVLEYTRPKREALEAKQQASDAKREAIFAAAKESGEPVLLSSHTETRRDNSEGEWGDYNFIIRTYAMPDGSTKTEEINTY